jgi:hypothetical protein
MAAYLSCCSATKKSEIHKTFIRPLEDNTILAKGIHRQYLNVSSGSTTLAGIR